MRPPISPSTRDLLRRAHEVYQAYTEGHGRRPEAVRAAMAWHGRHYRAGRLLYPAEARGRQ